MIRSLRNLVRLFRLARILARHDALFVFDAWLPALPWAATVRFFFRKRESGRPGQRLARALHDAGPSFIKLGQALSTRPDLLGEGLAADLSELQDRLPAFPGDKARAILEEELGQPIDALFRQFDEVPIAAASIAQVHLAIDGDGREVAVKVLRPGVERAFRRDLDLFFWVAGLIEETMPSMVRLRPKASIEALAESVGMEMDLRFEAAAACELADNFRGDPSFQVPAVDWSRTGRRVLTTERIVGIPIDERDALIAAGHDPYVILQAAAAAFFFQVFRDGFFHADLHAGNMFVRPNGAIAVVDFGIMGRLDRANRRHLGELLLAFLSRNYRRAAEVHFEAGWIPRDRSVDTFSQACRSIGEPILDKPQNEISIARLLGQLFQVTEAFDMQTQPQLLLLQKTMLLAEGTARRLCPEANMWLTTRPLIQQWVADVFSPQARAREALDEANRTLARLPAAVRNVERIAAEFADGQIRLHPATLEAIATRRSRQIATLLAWALLSLAVLGLLLV
jgi:ubiquinone biosynthesis protein